MKKILLVLMMCTFGAHAAVVVTHAYGYGVHPVVIAPRPVVVVPRPVVAAAVGAVGVGVYRHNERQDAYDEINHLQDQRINAYNQHHH
ncbi:hypothetical protein AL485_00830 [Serratia liquefaciens]|uniref:hypothetical protein n=1 Tax=Serratia liquefaciens TaxID=614 RepID=UPI00076B409D|nr:hypothetical protein [Serratia liquefaciens]AMG97820.1 hypothetical protein AL485_00830 [Serratia liquefaciens]